MCAVKSRLEDDAGLGHSRSEVVDLCWLGAFVVVITEGVVTKGAGHHTGGDGASGGLELARTLPLWALGEPEHEPIIWVVLLGKVGGEKEGYDE